jgi:predicted transposase/invertase (TIGR01784 family)
MTNKFADPKLDIVFKKLFGDSAILVDFINKTLPTKHIKKVEYLSTNIEPEIRVKKQSVLDVLCTDENGSKYIVEMQSAKEKGFEKRALYYASKTYGSQLDKRGQYSDLLEVIFIAITDFVIFPENTNYLSIHTIRDTKTNQQALKDLTFIFIEIPKYEEYENAQGIDEWIDLFKTASERKTFQTSNPIIKKAYDNLEMSNWTNVELLDFQAYQKKSLR